jgi:hypothetical protein
MVCRSYDQVNLLRWLFVCILALTLLYFPPYHKSSSPSHGGMDNFKHRPTALCQMAILCAHMTLCLGLLLRWTSETDATGDILQKHRDP